LGRFGLDPHAFFDSVYSDTAPWDIGYAQPDMVRMLADHPPEDPILDLGSATGDLAIHLATLGHSVVGLEFVETAVEQAREKASRLASDVRSRLRFEVGDASRPSALGVAFSAVVDSGFLHLLDPQETDCFVQELRASIAPGGRYYLHEFAFEFPIKNVPRAVTEQEVRSRFTETNGWSVVEVRQATFVNRVAQPTPAIVACVERLAG
jgi:SAM-dependent methyltransferase